MKVSIITVCLNSVDTIEETILSVKQQDYDAIEHIIIDGGSTDGTVKTLNRYRDCIFKIISESDKGIYDAMNKGLDTCSGEVVAFLNADDFYADSGIISQIINRFHSSKSDAVYGDLVYIDRSDSSRKVRYWKPGPYKKSAFYRGWVMPHPTFFCRKEIYRKYGGFNNTFKIAADFELMLRFVEKHQINVGYLPEVIVKMRTGGRANILNGVVRGNMEIIRAFRINGLHLSPFLFICKPITKLSQLFMRHEDT